MSKYDKGRRADYMQAVLFLEGYFMGYLDYHEGYHKALSGLAAWISNPAAPLDAKLCKPKYLDKVIGHIVENLDEFMSAPTTFGFEFEIVKGKMRILKRE